jgi:2'-5' RNA ligase
MSPRLKGEVSFETTRVFVALPLGSETALQLEAVQSHLLAEAERQGVSLRLTPNYQFHVTLAFLGDVSIGKLRSVLGTVSEVFMSHTSLRVRMKELVVFPSARHARVVGTALEDTSGALCRAAALLHGSLRREGLGLEEREFRPHITLARLRPSTQVSFEATQTWLAEPAFLCRTVAIYESVLGGQGSRYKVLHSVPLG